MIIVLADDFSGAAELAGIGFRYGLNVQIQLEFLENTEADILIIDTNTRSESKDAAIEKTIQFIKNIQQSKEPLDFFKKVDSVMVR